jgi:hypothetical protein
MSLNKFRLAMVTENYVLKLMHLLLHPIGAVLLVYLLYIILAILQVSELKGILTLKHQLRLYKIILI